MATNPYAVLGVDPKISQTDLKAAYRKLAKEFHPDLNPGNKKSEARFKEISAAYSLVDTEENRTKFDKGEADEKLAREAHARRGPYYNETQNQGGRYSNQYGGFDEDSLHSIFEQMGRQGFRSGPAGHRAEEPSQDETYKMEVDFKDAILGTETEMALPTGKKFRVKIPAGVDSGLKLRFKGQGEAGGDVFVQLIVRPSPEFNRVGSDLETSAIVPLATALLGGEVKVQTLEGSILLKVPAGIQAGQKMRVGNKGVPKGAVRGALIVTLAIQMPKGIDEDFKKAVESWRDRTVEAKESV